MPAQSIDMEPRPPKSPSRPRDVDGGRGGGIEKGGGAGGGGNGNVKSGVNGGGGNDLIYYRPSVHQITCRGAFHLRPSSGGYDENNENDGREGGERTGGKGGWGGGNNRGGRGRRGNDDDDEYLESTISDSFVCNGIRSKLRHVHDYPLARSKDEALGWFEGGVAGIGIDIGGQDRTVDPTRRRRREERSSSSRTGGVEGSEKGGKGGDGMNTHDDDDDVRGGSIESSSSSSSDVAFSSYGTTLVSVLTLREIPVIPIDDVRVVDPFAKNGDPFGGFGPMLGGRVGGGGIGGMMNPFGGFFGGYFGGGGGGGMMGGEDGNEPPYPRSPPFPGIAGVGGRGGDRDGGGGEEEEKKEKKGGGGNNDGNVGRAGGGRGWTNVTSTSVSSSTRMERDGNGKRVVTTVTKTTRVVDGKRNTETVITRRHVDDGGRIETEKVVEDNGRGGGASTAGTVPTSSGGGGTKIATTATLSSRGDGTSSPPAPRRVVPPTALPFHSTTMPNAVVEKPPTSPPFVAAIVTDCLLGVSVTDASSTDPDGFVSPTRSTSGTSKSSSSSSSSKNNGDKGSGNGVGKAGWRKTEYLFKLGRFIPPFMIVGKYYKDEEEEERRRRDMQKEYDDMRDRLRRYRWDSSARRDGAARRDDESSSSSESKDKDESRRRSGSADLPITNAVTSRTEYYLQRTYVQMAKNASMMSHILTDVMMRPDFPRKVSAGGERIFDNIRPTAERTAKLMRDVWDMWMGWANGR